LTLPPERRRQLQQLGLRALLKRRFGADVAEGAAPVRFNGGAAVVAGELAAVFADSETALGSAVDTAAARGASQLCFFCEHNTRNTARRAAEFRMAVSVIDPEGDFATLEPAPVPDAGVMPDRFEPDAARMRSAGLEVVWEHGVLRGEWLGLEVARAGDDGFEVGVGRHDRAANRELYPDGPPDAFLDQAVATIRELRRPGAPPHPANQLSPERWLRAIAVGHPSIVGLDAVHAGPTPVERADLRQRAVAPGWGDAQVIVCSVGVDPDVVAQAADSRAQARLWPGGPGPAVTDLTIVVPEGDDHPLTRRLAGLLRHPAHVRTVPAGWRDLGP
jgi:hypothetical protein